MKHPQQFFSFSEYDQLLYLVYEHVQVAEGNLDPHLWAYHSRITLEHLRQYLQQQNMREKCPILYAFLQEVCIFNHCYPKLNSSLHFALPKQLCMES